MKGFYYCIALLYLLTNCDGQEETTAETTTPPTTPTPPSDPPTGNASCSNADLALTKKSDYSDKYAGTLIADLGCNKKQEWITRLGFSDSCATCYLKICSCGSSACGPFGKQKVCTSLKDACNPECHTCQTNGCGAKTVECWGNLVSHLPPVHTCPNDYCTAKNACDADGNFSAEGTSAPAQAPGAVTTVPNTSEASNIFIRGTLAMTTLLGLCVATWL